MLTVISPAKKIDSNAVELPSSLTVTTPDFGQDAAYLAGVAGALETDGLMQLMGISENLAALNMERFSNFGAQATKPAAFAFAGDTYQGLEAATLEEPELAWAQNHLRILSGLYGILRPLDAMEPYRLEMGSRLNTDHGKTLYAYWGARLAEALNLQAKEVNAAALVNCASQEYFGAVDQKTLSLPVITPVFKDRKDGKARIVSFYAKKARGAMARFIIQNQITTIEGLKDFNTGGYAYDAEASDADVSGGGDMVFTRDDPKA